MNKDLGIYIHIPFCISKCYYCDFVSYANSEDKIEEYIDTLCKEILDKSEILSEYNIKTIYFGGGTPSFIDSKYIVKIMEILSLFIEDKERLEITIEINPATVNKEKLLDYKNCGINRLSIGLQSTHDEILKKIGRKHSYNDFLNTLELANGLFDNISVDVMYPLPDLKYDNFCKTIDDVVGLKDNYNIKHISIYNLEIHDNTKLKFLLDEGFVSLVDEDVEYEMKKYLEDNLLKVGYNKYEISNFSIPGFESKHNTSYWNQGEYLGFGVCASSYILGTRYKNIDDLNKYIACITNGARVISEEEHLDKLDLMREYVILKLRLTDGFLISDFSKKFSTDIYDVFGIELKKLLDLKLIDIDSKKRIFLTKRGTEIANTVWQEFI